MIIYNRGLRAYKGLDNKADTILKPGDHIEVSDKLGKSLLRKYGDLVDFDISKGISAARANELDKREQVLAQREASLAAREAELAKKEAGDEKQEAAKK